MKTSRSPRHVKIEENMHDVIKGHEKAIGPVDADEVAALTRHIGVRTNMEGVPMTTAELVTATGIVMEELGAEVQDQEAHDNYQGKPERIIRRRPRGPTSYHFFGSSGGAR